jgi:hypothetical protein
MVEMHIVSSLPFASTYDSGGGAVKSNITTAQFHTLALPNSGIDAFRSFKIDEFVYLKFIIMVEINRN